MLLASSYAATYVVSGEAESGSVAGCATTGSDANASDGQFVRFGDCSGGETSTASSVSQYGITWTFDKAYPVGQFVNGDHWVVGPVTITSITPAYSSGLNGWQVNPPLTENRVLGNGTCVNNDCGGQSLDSAGSYWDASRLPTLPYTANGGQSIVKAISRTNHGSSCAGSNPCLQTAAILTVLSSVPPNNGATVFRPPYVGTNKPLFSTANFNTQISNLPRLASTSTIDSDLPTMQNALDWVKRPDIGYHIEEVNDFHPVSNVLPAGETNPYAPGISAVYIDSVLRALIAKSGDDENKRRELLLALTQRGIDIWGMRAAGMHWYAGGGTNFGPRGPIVFAAWMLNDQTIKNTITSSARNDFAETGSVWPSNRADGKPVWGQDRGGESSYWQAVNGQVGNMTTWDPYFHIDGAYAPSTSYQQCCTSAAIKGQALMVHLIPGMDAVWNDPLTLAYVDRWVTHGMLTQPDPCAPVSQGGGPNGSGGCILDPDLTPGSTMTNFSCQVGKQCGRFPDTDNYNPDGDLGDWGNSFFQSKMWTQYGP